MHIEIAQIFTQIVSFLVVLWVLSKFAWKPLLKILDDREKKIRSEFDQIEQEKKEAAELVAEYQNKLAFADQEVKEIIRKGHEAGQLVAQEIENKAHAEAKKIISHTQEELKKEVLKAKSELKTELVDMALTATEKLMKKQMDEKEQKRLLNHLIEAESSHERT